METPGFRKRFFLLMSCGFGVALLMAVEYGRGVLSSQLVGPALLVFCVLFFIALRKLVFSPRASRTFEAVASPEIEQTGRKRTIRNLKFMVAVLVLLLLNGLRYVGSFPLWMLLVAITINLLLTASLIRIILQLQKRA